MHFAGVTDPDYSHLKSMLAVGRALVRRGHRFTVFQAGEAPHSPQHEGISVHNLDPYARGKNLQLVTPPEQADIRYYCETLPSAFQQAGVEAVVVDQMMGGEGFAAEALNLPFVSICNATPVNKELGVPPFFVPWPYSATRLGYLRNWLAYLARDLYLWPLHRVLNQYRRQWRLPPCRAAEDAFSSLAQITQFIAEFDFPRKELPEHFHYVGPFDRSSPVGVDFPFHRLDKRPLVYMAFGTRAGERPDIWKAVAEACLKLNLQLVISTGQKDMGGGLPRLPGDPIVVYFAPQSALLQKARIFVTHGGVNSVFESLVHAVPMVAVPFMGDQHGNAARINYQGVGQVLRQGRDDARAWSIALKSILEEPSYRDRARHFSGLVRQSGGADRAAEIIEQAATTRQPVNRG